MGIAEGPSPFAGSLRVSLRYTFLPFLTRKGARGMVERVFQRPARVAGVSISAGVSVIKTDAREGKAFSKRIAGDSMTMKRPLREGLGTAFP